MRLEIQKLKKIITISVFLSLFSFGFITFAYQAYAQAIPVISPAELQQAREKQAQDTWWNRLVEQLKKAGSKALNSAIRSSLNSMAYDLATYLGSGSQGQKPVWMTENPGKFLSNVADNAAGVFIEQLGREGIFGTKFNLCEPSLDVKIKIGLGLVQYQRPKAPACTFTKMTQNWENEAQRLRDMKSSDYLKMAQEMFEPTSNDLGIAWSIQTAMFEDIEGKVGDKDKERQETDGWLEFNKLTGRKDAIPNNAKNQIDLQNQLMSENFGAWTGDALVDATNVFLNQLAITAFNRLLLSLGKDSPESTSPYAGDYGGLGKYQASPSRGATDLASDISKIVQPSFTTRADYDILAELSMCSDPAKAGPTNCVITDRFRQAVTERKTVAEAIKLGYLNKNGAFAFIDKYEPKYMDEAYPYRSLIILRKYRILPVGWELAGQYIRQSQDGINPINVNLGDMVACFNQADEHTGYFETWCEGLVDPNWVLKAPLNYCKREGYGPEINSQTVVGEGQSSYVAISRNKNYCADEQSCIQENDDGSCSAYGYCTEERRKWDFSSDSCDAKYNTCQTFKAENGKTISYLENTLDYGGCSIDNAGCKAYATEYDYSAKQWSSIDALHLDRDAEKCDARNEGCRALIRTKEGIGSNLIANSGFEDELAGTIGGGAGTQVNDAYEGRYGLQLSGTLSADVTAGPGGYSVAGERFILSFYAKNCGTGTFGINGVTDNMNTAVDSWTRQTFSYVYPSTASADNNVNIAINPSVASCVIDALKLERNSQATVYSNYGSTGMVYEKILPDYLAAAATISGISGNHCYEDTGKLRTNAPAECKNFVRKCSAEEVNCDIYTSYTDGVSIPAKALAVDYCAAECVGFDTYVQGATAFDSQRSDYFIPSTADTCGAEAVGCEEFTNLDKVAKGGEGIEYYSSLKQCVKTDASTGLSQCSEFYTWEGSDESGYQLKVMQLKIDASNGPYATDPAFDAANCSAAIYNLPSSDPSHNPECRQFYNRSGAISYHLVGQTVTCSDDCYAFRMSKKNVDPSVTAGNCSGTDKSWDAATSQCIVCKNSGIWDASQQACIYMAIPDEGQKCAADANGCREYSGNTGNNMRVVLNNNFEGSLQGWTTLAGSSVSLSNNALMVGGQSLSVNRQTSMILGRLAQKDKSYVLSFIAKAGAGSVNLNARIIGDPATPGSPASDFSGSVALSSTEWQRYEMNLAKLGHDVSDAETLAIIGSGAFFIDDIRLTEITDRYYLIRDSWVTPDSCNQDIEGKPYPLYALGCDAYSDSDSNTHYLRSFSNLCQDSAVGCELLIDTQNSTAPGAVTSSGVVPQVSVPADSFIYAVFDAKKQCGAIDKGCQRLGNPFQYDGSNLYTDIYLKNDPDKYSVILCSASSTGCSEWQVEDGLAYFRDPGEQVCEWRQKKNTPGGGWGWYKKKVKKCEGTGSVCLTASDCTASSTCVLQADDESCPTSFLKTFGEGQGRIDQPAMSSNGTNWAGICPASESGCSEYIDPVSEFSNNLVLSNSTVTLDPYTLYILESGSLDVGANQFYRLGSDNLATPVTGGQSARGLYYSGALVGSAPFAATGIVRKTAVDYQLRSKVDAKTCNGLVDFEKGCVLFNERTQNGAAGLAGSTYDAYLTLTDNLGMAPQPNALDANNNANKLLKVTPDRECGVWLACEVPNPLNSGVCKKIGICNKLDTNGNCERFAGSAGPSNQTYPGAASIADKTGYAKLGYSGTAINMSNSDHKYPDNYWPFEAMDPYGRVVYVNNGGFENSKLNPYSGKKDSGAKDASGNIIWVDDYDNMTFFPTFGWDCKNTTGPAAEECYKNTNVLNNPVAIQQDKICFRVDPAGNCDLYAPEGKNVLRVNADFGNAYPIETKKGEYMEVKPGVEYLVTGYINTSKLSSGSVNVGVLGWHYDFALAATSTFTPLGEIASKDYSKYPGWQQIFITISKNSPPTPANITHISLELRSSDNRTIDSSLVGAYYFDDIKIRPALKSQGTPTDYWSTQQSCRLYPAEDSLSCDYYDKSGVRYKGNNGYCLEYDRFPGAIDACLQWWTVPNKSQDVATELNEICGDQQVTGNEDCECKDLEDPSCNKNEPGYANLGMSAYNQYKCDNCSWTEGWCGDGRIGYSEHCDWKENDINNPNFNGQTCTSNPGGFSEYAHGIGYSRFLNGVMAGCFDNSEKNNKKAGTSGQRCTLDLSDCNDLLIDGVHTRADCESTGGTVVKQDGSAFNPNADADYGQSAYFCKYTGDCPPAADALGLCQWYGGSYVGNGPNCFEVNLGPLWHRANPASYHYNPEGSWGYTYPITMDYANYSVNPYALCGWISSSDHGKCYMVPGTYTDWSNASVHLYNCEK